MSARRNRRSGNILVLTAFMMIGMIAVLAFSIDLGYLYVAKTELQRSADSAAMAAAWELLEDQAVFGAELPSQTQERARAAAATYASYNPILTQQPSLDDDDVKVGYLNDPWDETETIDTGAAHYNAVRVRVQRTATINGAVPMLFGRVLGVDKTPLQARATAVLMSNFGGFRASDDGNLPLLPFALDLETWNDLLAGVGSDDWTWDAANEAIVSGGDGVLEMNLYPQGTGSPGNRGTVDVGSSNNSTADIARQILHGASPDDLSHHGGKLELDEYGELELNADTGISAGFKDELAEVQGRGKPRIIPVFSQVSGSGNNAQYTIVQFVGVRIMDVKLTGSMSSKRVIVQPAKILVRGG
ncbi:MAG: hypothetical protein KY475_23990, partial [Planctomycetes bacterium]|nr:hypothetical protein [Planctomycetota bacterium]